MKNKEKRGREGLTMRDWVEDREIEREKEGWRDG